MYEDLQLGDILILDRIFYKHYGIYVGNQSVIHYADKESDWGEDIYIHETTLDNFAKGENIIVGKFSEEFKRTHKIYSPKETVMRARSRLGEREYHLITNNCEHFALWCKIGESRSIQVENTFATILNLFSYNEENKLTNLSADKQNKIKNLNIAPVEEIEFLSSDNIISFFKQKEIITKLKNNKNLIAVAIKANKNVILCIYDKNHKSTGADFKIYHPKSLDKDVIEMFADKDMIILQ